MYSLLYSKFAFFLEIYDGSFYSAISIDSKIKCTFGITFLCLKNYLFKSSSASLTEILVYKLLKPIVKKKQSLSTFVCPNIFIRLKLSVKYFQIWNKILSNNDLLKLKQGLICDYIQQQLASHNRILKNFPSYLKMWYTFLTTRKLPFCFVQFPFYFPLFF